MGHLKKEQFQNFGTEKQLVEFYKNVTKFYHELHLYDCGWELPK